MDMATSPSARRNVLSEASDVSHASHNEQLEIGRSQITKAKAAWT